MRLAVVPAALLGFLLHGPLVEPAAPRAGVQDGGRPVPAPDRPPADVAREARASEASLREFDARMESAGVVIDRERKLVALRGRFCAPRQPLEYLVTAERGSHYESLVAIDARPSDVAAALHSLGVEKGTGPVRKPKETKPTAEEIAAGATPYDVIAGTGDGVLVLVEWNDDRGFHRHRIEDLVFERPEGRTIPHARFVFVDSMMLEPRSSRDVLTYGSNADGNFGSCGFGGAPVIAYPKPHPFAMEGDFEIYQPNWTLVPSEPLPVTLLLGAEDPVVPLVPRLAPPAYVPPKAPDAPAGESGSKR